MVYAHTAVPGVGNWTYEQARIAHEESEGCFNSETRSGGSVRHSGGVIPAFCHRSVFGL